ncbi:MAG: alpha-galactosidase [Clostridia bacterium]|nr:alpha-galactosidase [Clostridia bacterium]
MSDTITYSASEKRFCLRTDSTLYVIDLYDGKYPLQRYYGPAVDTLPDAFHVYRAFSPYPTEYGPGFSFDTILSEYPTFGNGDMRHEAMRVKGPDGSGVTDFVFIGFKIDAGREPIPGLPYARPDADTETLEMHMEDPVTGCVLTLRYVVFPHEDVIARSYSLRNASGGSVVLENGMSLCLDIPRADFDLTYLPGTYGSERFNTKRPLSQGCFLMDSRRGSSSHHMSPFFALSDRGASEESGRAYGFNLVYSGNFRSMVEVDQNQTTRVLTGINPDTFSWKLAPGEVFHAPEAVMTYTDKGLGQVSRNFHRFANRHLARPCGFERRPVVLNTWEGTFFNINEDRLVKYAKEAAALGIDMLVMDDGWFGTRRNDLAGLGDWWECRDLFPDGLGAFVSRVKAQGVRFGIWIEPEMVNPDSDLYRAHPDWCLHVPGRRRSESRNQLVLDMGNPDVLDYLKTTFSKTFDGVGLDYFKWDMNRHLCEVWSSSLPADRQGEAYHRYVLGVYDLADWFRTQYPDAMIEMCSGGGGRYDLGMLPYCSQIWTSDTTDAVHRTKIQSGSLYGYPASMMSCHVSNHYNVVEDEQRMEFRWRVAMGGPLGYELDPTSLSDKVKETIRAQIAEWRNCEQIVLWGDYYRLTDPLAGAVYAYCHALPDAGELYLNFLQLVPEEPKTYVLKLIAADPDAVYKDRYTGLIVTGQQLRDGFAVRSERTDQLAKAWYFVRQ